MDKSKRPFINYLRITEMLYSVMILFSFYLLLISRTGEAHTIWEVLNPFFIPTLFATSFLLITIIFAPEKVAHKLTFVIIHSILIHSFFSIIFPAGDMSGQQMVLGRTRLVFDNAVMHGWTPWPTMSIASRVYEWFRGITFQAAISVVSARMLSIDLLWVHLSLIPVLWGVFVPIAAFMTTKALGGKEESAILSSLLMSAFPYATYFGAISVHISLGFIFFFYSLYFMLRYLDLDDSKTKSLMVISSFFSFLSHSLTGIMSFSLLFLALAFKSYRSEKASPVTAKASLVISFLVSASILPLSFIYVGLFQPTAGGAVFTLGKLYKLPFEEIVGLLFLGELAYSFDPKTILLIVVGPLIAILSMLYLLYTSKGSPSAGYRVHVLFLSTAFLMILVDYRILKLFMEGLPLNEERLWVFRDFMAAPFVALAIYAIVSSLRTLEARSLPFLSVSSLKASSRGKILYVLGLLFTLNILIPVTMAGWLTVSLSAAYPQAAPRQTTWYELDAVRYIEENTHEKYVVIGDVWTIFAGEVIVGVNNPRAYYFLEFNKTGFDLFSNWRQEPSPQWMLLAMDLTDTTVAYFVVTEPRLGTDNFNHTVSKALQNGLQIYGPTKGFGNGRLYIFYHEKEDNL